MEWGKDPGELVLRSTCHDMEGDVDVDIFP